MSLFFVQGEITAFRKVLYILLKYSIVLNSGGGDLSFLKLSASLPTGKK